MTLHPEAEREAIKAAHDLLNESLAFINSPNYSTVTPQQLNEAIRAALAKYAALTTPPASPVEGWQLIPLIVKPAKGEVVLQFSETGTLVGVWRDGWLWLDLAWRGGMCTSYRLAFSPPPTEGGKDFAAGIEAAAKWHDAEARKWEGARDQQLKLARDIDVRTPSNRAAIAHHERHAATAESLMASNLEYATAIRSLSPAPQAAGEEGYEDHPTEKEEAE